MHTICTMNITGPAEKKGGYCLNCDNKHGCKTETPPCLMAMMEENITDMNGKDYLIKTKRLSECKECPFFRTCWRAGEYAGVAR